MFYYFDTDVATEFGMGAAVLFQNIAFWVRHNEANKSEDHFHENKYWCYNTMSAYLELFPFLTEYTIRKALKDLEEKGMIVTGDFNEKPFDKTKWYGLGPVGEKVAEAQSTEKAVKEALTRFVENCNIDSLDSTNGDCEINEPIPNNIPDNIQEPIEKEINFSLYSQESEKNDKCLVAEPTNSEYSKIVAEFINSPMMFESFCKNNRVSSDKCREIVAEIATEWEFTKPKHNNSTEAKQQLLRALETKINIRRQNGLLLPNKEKRLEQFNRECKELKNEGYDREALAKFYKYYTQPVQDGTDRFKFETMGGWDTKTRFKMFLGYEKK